MRNDYERGFDIALGDDANKQTNYERGFDIALGDVKKQTNVYERGDIVLGRKDVPKAHSNYVVLHLPTDGYGVLPVNNKN